MMMSRRACVALAPGLPPLGWLSVVSANGEEMLIDTGSGAGAEEEEESSIGIVGEVDFIPSSALRDRILYLRGVTLSPRSTRGGSSPRSPRPSSSPPGLTPRERMRELMQWGAPSAAERATTSQHQLL